MVLRSNFFRRQINTIITAWDLIPQPVCLINGFLPDKYRTVSNRKPYYKYRTVPKRKTYFSYKRRKSSSISLHQTLESKTRH